MRKSAVAFIKCSEEQVVELKEHILEEFAHDYDGFEFSCTFIKQDKETFKVTAQVIGVPDDNARMDVIATEMFCLMTGFELGVACAKGD